MFKTYISVILIMIISGCITAQADSLSSNINVILNENELQYIYNRIVDIALRDERSSPIISGMFYSEDYLKYETLIITIDSLLNDDIFRVSFIEELQNIEFKCIHYSQSKFDKISIINTMDIKFVNYYIIPQLKDNHMMHVQFSPLYQHDNRIYTGAKLIKQLKTKDGAMNYISNLFFEIEICDIKSIYFRRMFIPLGFRDGIEEYYIKDFNDRRCN